MNSIRLNIKKHRKSFISECLDIECVEYIEIVKSDYFVIHLDKDFAYKIKELVFFLDGHSQDVEWDWDYFS